MEIKEQNVEIEKVKGIIENLNFYFEKFRLIFAIIIVSIVLLNAALGFYSISRVMNNPNEKISTNINPLSFLFTGSAPKEDPNFKVDYDEKQAGHMYGAEFTKEKGIFGFIENYIQVYKIKKGVDRDFINTSKELEKQYQKH